MDPAGQLCWRLDSLASLLFSPPSFLELAQLALRSLAPLHTSPSRGNRCRPLSKSSQKCWEKNMNEKSVRLSLPLQDYIPDILSRLASKCSSPPTPGGGWEERLLPAYERLQCAFCIWQEGPEKTLEKAVERMKG